MKEWANEVRKEWTNKATSEGMEKWVSEWTKVMYNGNTWDTAPGFEKVALVQQLVCTRGGGVVWSQAPYHPILHRRKKQRRSGLLALTKKSLRMRFHLAKKRQDFANQRQTKKRLRLSYPILQRRVKRKDHALRRWPKKSLREGYPPSCKQKLLTPLDPQ